MSRRQGWLWMLAGVILAMVAALLVYRLLSSAVQTSASRPEVNTRPVIVALQDIPMRSVIGKDMVAVRDMPVDFIPKDAATDLNDVVDKMAIADIKAGEVVLLSRLESPTNVTRNIALRIPQGKVVIALPAQDLLNRVGMLKAGDHVDILFTLSFGSGPRKNVAIAAMQNVTVQAVVTPPSLQPSGNQAGIPSRQEKAILIAVDPQEALVLKYLLDSGAALDFVLRPPDDDSAPFMEPVDLPYMEDTYDFEAPSETAPTGTQKTNTGATTP